MAVKMPPTSVIVAQLGIQPNGVVHQYFTQTCAIHMDKYVPYDEGNLADYRIIGNEIHYQQPYAQYQYYGISKSGKELHYQPTMHPLAHSYWDKEMWNAEKNDVIKEIQNFIRRR